MHDIIVMLPKGFQRIGSHELDELKSSLKPRKQFEAPFLMILGEREKGVRFDEGGWWVWRKIACVHIYRHVSFLSE